LPGNQAQGSDVNGQALVAGPSNGVPASEIERTLEPNEEADNEDAVEPLELSHSLEEFVADASRESSWRPKAEPHGPTLFDLVDDPIGVRGAGAVVDALEPTLALVDPSKWFENNDSGSENDGVKKQSAPVSEEGSPRESSFDSIQANAPGAASGEVFSSSAASDAKENADEVVDFGGQQATWRAQNERRRDPREASTDLVWVEYFDSTMACTGKEAARADNINAGGMRVCVKAAPPELERVIVSYPYRGFESCSMIRSRHRDEDGQEKLCLEFVDREWKPIPTSTRVKHPANQAGPGRILLADDDSAFRKILGSILVRAGYDVMLAEDGESAVERATSEKPDLVITDGLMPKLHGFQVCKAVKKLRPQPRVIMLTAVYTNPNYMWEAKAKFGADDIITKPCQIADLLRKIENQISLGANIV